ncbi:MAG: DUF1343 domain-containing protein [Sandaracinaceae bacterium]|nr:DUF1343 domain-containing protein [Sandaracinaceae bacterium]
MARVATGLDRIAAGDAEALAPLRGRAALLAHPASVDARLVHAREVLRDAGARLVALFGPEHGYGGEAQDMIEVGHARDPEGLPIHSLYGATEEELTPRPEHLEGLDVLIVDLQDVGSRYYTYVWTAALALKAAARAGVRTVILDRPNPLGGVAVEGAPQRPGHRSFVGLYDVAVRHGMTIGEIATMVRALDGLDDDALTVVPMRGWERAMRFDATGLPWVLPSPNMPTLDTALVYPGGCLIEGTALSEGRGLTRPFEMWGRAGPRRPRARAARARRGRGAAPDHLPADLPQARQADLRRRAGARDRRRSLRALRGLPADDRGVGGAARRSLRVAARSVRVRARRARDRSADGRPRVPRRGRRPARRSTACWPPRRRAPRASARHAPRGCSTRSDVA